MLPSKIHASVASVVLIVASGELMADEVVTEEEQVITIQQQPAPPPAAPMKKPMAAPAPVPAPARNPWYVGAGIGSAHLTGGADSIDPGAAGSSVLDLDDDDTGWKVFLGYQLNPYFAAELSYADLGEFSETHAAGAGTVTNTVKPSAWCLDGVGSLPFDSGLSLLAKLGACRWDDDMGENGTSPVFGLGARYDFSRHMGARLEWERYTDVSHDTGDVDLYSINLIYDF